MFLRDCLMSLYGSVTVILDRSATVLNSLPELLYVSPDLEGSSCTSKLKWSCLNCLVNLSSFSLSQFFKNIFMSTLILFLAYLDDLEAVCSMYRFSRSFTIWLIAWLIISYSICCCGIERFSLKTLNMEFKVLLISLICFEASIIDPF